MRNPYQSPFWERPNGLWAANSKGVSGKTVVFGLSFLDYVIGASNNKFIMLIEKCKSKKCSAKDTTLDSVQNEVIEKQT